jgi:superfamily II DNA or RNA helicase/HKD family nuclease
VYEHLITRDLERRLMAVDSDLVQREDLDPADAADLLARHIGTLARRALRAVPGDRAQRLVGQVAVANQIAASIAEAVAHISPNVVDEADAIAGSRDVLTAIVGRPTAPLDVAFPARPHTPFSTGALLVNGRGQPRIGHEVASEMASADQVDLLCAFIKWQGLRILEAPIRALIERGGRLRVITTTYLGATDQRALDRLAELGADIKISYETRTTRLHAKAWLFRRAAGTTTAYVGSSNMSRSALMDGLEWNVRVSILEQPYVIETFKATFDEYWEDAAFEEYQPQRDGPRLRGALALERGAGPADLEIEVTNLDVRPYPYQQEILEELAAQREVHNNWHNLVVMATGTGKTVVAALDYRHLRQAGTVDSLLFVAHQEHILRQNRSVFRHVLRDGTFGETLVGGERPNQWRHVFASVQSLSRMNLIDLEPGRFDMVIVDEFHHAEARTYTQLLAHLQPRVLLGLTATPERADGQDILHWFNGRTTVELRLWEALERQLLAPFQYFGIHDDVDLSTLRWKRGQGYQAAELSNVYTGHDARARIILQAVKDKADVNRMRAIGFCVSIEHAEFMARCFINAGVPARAVTSTTDTAGRLAAVNALKNGELKVLFTVDLFNEGVDLPMVDTILLLRPTQSATIFLQQLGRGLRLADNKPCLVVLDFIGAQHAEFRFDLRYRALTGVSRRALARDVEQDFPTLPAGCHIELDRVAKDVVLRNLRRTLRMRTGDLAKELRQLGDVSLADFLAETGQDIEDLYRSSSAVGWAGLRRMAGLDATPPGPLDSQLGSGIGRSLHIDDPVRLTQLHHVAEGGTPAPGRLADMLHFSLFGGNTPLVEFDERLRQLHQNAARCDELRQISGILHDKIHRIAPLQAVTAVPLTVHARYSRDEACAAFGITNPATVREGVKWVEAEQADIFFVTLTKTERHYSPTTMYADRAITPRLFQWESQSTTRGGSPTGQRYIHHAKRGSTVHLFLRETKEADGNLGVPPYLYAGTMAYQNHTGDRPMRIQWHLNHPLPADIYHAARVAAG